MSIKKLLEELDEVLKETVEDENKLADTKRKYRVYVRAYEGLEELQDLLEEGVNPVDGKMDAETEALYDKIQELINQIYSASLAFEV